MRYFLRAIGALSALFLMLPGGAATAAGPAITAVSPILPLPDQTITISGKGFGRFRPYVGDSRLLRIRDLTRHWDAGYAGDRPFDKVGLAVLSWSDSRIVLGGFRGAYGRNAWRLNPGDRLLIEVWNPQTHAGPATRATTVAIAL
jgi:hypothetical protein